MAAAGGVTAEMNAEGGGEPGYIYNYYTTVLRPDATAFRQLYQVDEKFETADFFPVRLCMLQPPEYFQGCIDTPTWECSYEGNWFTDCVETPRFECG
jgi:hypothetical protein